MDGTSDHPGSQRLPANLPHGRRLTLRHGSDADGVLEIRSPDGGLELSIRLTAQGPALTVRAASVAIEAAGDASLVCDRLRVDASGEIEMRSGGQLRLRSTAETFIDADLLHLNSLDRSGYHDDPNQAGSS